mgnify:CR=1 FL=1
MFNEMKEQQEKRQEGLLKKFDESILRLERFINIADVSFPKVEENSEIAVKEAKEAKHRFYGLVLTKLRHAWMRRIFIVLIKNKKLQKQKRSNITSILDKFRKYHRYNEFNKFRNILYKIKENARTDSTPGAYQKIKEM